MPQKHTSKDWERYADMLFLPHHVSDTHPHMAAADRAAQFSPFSALTGYGDAVRETGRLTDARIELDEDAKQLLDEKLQMLLDRMPNAPKVQITYFQPDKQKEGGTYLTARGQIKRIIPEECALIMENRCRISLNEITEIEFEEQ